MVIHTKKQVITKTIHKKMDLPQSLRDKIDEFWNEQIVKKIQIYLMAKFGM